MKRVGILLVMAGLVACTGSLTDEQRKRIRESMEQGEIKKVTESEIMQSAFDYGRQVSAAIETTDKSFTNLAKLDSLEQAYQVEIVILEKGNKSLRDKEKQLLDAYLSDAGNNDNVQLIGVDSILYTKPYVRERFDGSNEFIRALGLRITRKQVVLSIKK
jgi:hypothetical protein